jgi:hypothetical protein
LALMMARKPNWSSAQAYARDDPQPKVLARQQDGGAGISATGSTQNQIGLAVVRPGPKTSIQVTPFVKQD